MDRRRSVPLAVSVGAWLVVVMLGPPVAAVAGRVEGGAVAVAVVRHVGRRERGVPGDQVGGLLGDHHHGRVDVAVGDEREDRGVDDDEALDAVHAHRRRGRPRTSRRRPSSPCTTGAARSRRRRAPSRGSRSSVSTLAAGRQLAVVVRRERRLVEDVAGHPDRLHPLLAVGRRRQVVELHRRVDLRVRRPDPHPAAGVGVHRADVHLVAVALGRRRAVVPDRDREEVEHQVRVVDVLVAAGEAAALEVVGGAEAAAVEQPVVGDPGRARQRRPGAIETGCFEAYWM